MTSRILQGKVAVVTGASSGLGERFARVLASAGATVGLVARRAERLAALVRDIERDGGHAAAFRLDVANADEIGPCMDEIERRLGPISILVNNAGVSGSGRALDVSCEVFDRTFAINVRGVFVGAREGARRMLASGVAERGDARIINVASIGAFTNLGGLSIYCASKAAVASFTKGLAREWAGKNIAVNALCPGFIETELNSDWISADAGRRQIEKFPRKRVIAPSALDDALLLLAGLTGAFMTGALLTVDDGQSL